MLAGVDRDEKLEVEDWQQALAEAESTLESLGAEEESVVGQLAALGEEGVPGLGGAESRLDKATATVVEVRAQKEREQQEQESVRQELDRVRGELGVRREQAAALDHEGARWQVESLTAELDALPAAERPVSERFRELTRGRYGLLALGPHLETQGIEAAGGRQEVDVLSVGTRDQLSTILRLSLAQQLGTAVLLDDQLAQSDPRSMGWFGDLLRECAGDVRIVVLTCRPEDYLRPEEMAGRSQPPSRPSPRLWGGRLRIAADGGWVVRRFRTRSSRCGGGEFCLPAVQPDLAG